MWHPGAHCESIVVPLSRFVSSKGVSVTRPKSTPEESDQRTAGFGSRLLHAGAAHGSLPWFSLRAA